MKKGREFLKNDDGSIMNAEQRKEYFKNYMSEYYFKVLKERRTIERKEQLKIYMADYYKNIYKHRKIYVKKDKNCLLDDELKKIQHKKIKQKEKYNKYHKEYYYRDKSFLNIDDVKPTIIDNPILNFND
jgi:hypothetical protein